jgi:hypothetical protein
MSISCCICGMWYHMRGRDTFDICPDCFDANFKESQELRLPQETPEELRRFQDPPEAPPGLTPRQRQAMQRMAERCASEETTPC